MKQEEENEFMKQLSEKRPDAFPEVIFKFLQCVMLLRHGIC